MLKKILLTSIFFFLSSSKVWAGPVVTISAYPSSVNIDQEFNVGIELSSLEASASYYLKSLGGPDGFKVYTWSEKIADWSAWNASWTNMPEANASFEGKAKVTIISKFSNNPPLGLNSYKIRLRKVGSSTNYDFSEVLIEVLPSPTSTPIPTPTLQEESVTTSTPTPKPVTSTPKPTIKINTTPTLIQKAGLTPTLKATNKTTTPSGEILGQETATLSSFYPYDKFEDSDENQESTPSAQNKFWPKIFLFVGLAMIFSSAFLGWRKLCYTQFK
jgi:hypothetical protein